MLVHISDVGRFVCYDSSLSMQLKKSLKTFMIHLLKR